MSAAPPHTFSANRRVRLLTFGRLPRVFGSTVILASSLALAPHGLHAQGCSQCTQAVGQTPAATQTAYRKGILVLVLAAGGVFTSALVVLKRFR